MDLSLLKKISLIVVIAILFSFLNFSIIDMLLPELNYDDYCHGYEIYPDPASECADMIPADAEIAQCNETGGEIRQNYSGKTRCPAYECVQCKQDYDKARESRDLSAFLIASFLGLVCVILGMYVTSDSEVFKWVWNGVLIAGIITIFIGTGEYFRYLGRFLKPLVLMAEIGLIIWIAVKTTQKKLSEKESKKKKNDSSAAAKKVVKKNTKKKTQKRK